MNVGAWAMIDDLSWPGILMIQTPVTVILIWTEMRLPRYHGIWANRLNPKLADYPQAAPCVLRAEEVC